jgi:murein L,D-transpeptidase YcbB/YkuD
VGVNLPMFWLWTWDPRAAPAAVAGPAMRVIVGRAASTPTPVFIAGMTHLTFQPYWNVPRSIVRAEILPALARDPSYLRLHDMELVRGPGDEAPALPETPELLRELEQGTLRVRQRPGPRNPLGGVKFAVANESQIYLHATPARELFLRGRRDFSHGCIRVEDPIGLARWALAGRPGWGPEEIAAAYQGSRTVSVSLPEPVQVVVYYSTALARPGDGALLFSEDLYGLDARLEAAWAHSRGRIRLPAD